MDTPRGERLQKLIQTLKEGDKIHLRDAAQSLGVSEMTIRRDLNDNPYSLIVLGGYIVIDPKNNNVNHYFLSEQKSKNIDEKRYIGKLAAQQIEENDTVFFDSGTTLPFIIENIPDELRFTGVCYSLNTFLSLKNKPNCTVILCGGEFKTSSYIFTPVGANNELDFIRPNKAFISAAGVSLEHGVTSFILDEVRMKMQAMSASKQKILIADAYKFDKTKPGRFGTLNQFDKIITDQQPDKSYLDYCYQHDIGVIY
ncbi:DNA-binding transcriptional repressor DeoR [Pragia fontium]|uniref:Transcriptional regulator, DeoR family n=2 Tax=Pragia fontium TaxID=82985 RepID=A0AAJ5BII7_9GAMM|nr:DNA-binding transcriptional repressor DeoR [Pragia fontium]AKJ43516.1 transcriptional regulator [Pragia fontium]SFD36832.1 transcriptional regulator, DeoR family [Pragia fontium DSM 5563 = ATCC 49100]SUB84005.1 Deoxyribose operon repressor [Pragia fontium]VEJ56904.1 Deoxyribose operon repressor [Pragia fontium]GKX64215.1 DNA-binding transcriptional repressor DeoR [Pragia fontium]